MDMAGSIRIERTAAAWLARRDAGGWVARDQAELDAWLAASTAHRVAWLRLQAAWRESGRLKALGAGLPAGRVPERKRSEEHTSELQSLMRISYDVFCLKKKNKNTTAKEQEHV